MRLQLLSRNIVVKHVRVLPAPCALECHGDITSGETLRKNRIKTFPSLCCCASLLLFIFSSDLSPSFSFFFFASIPGAEVPPPYRGSPRCLFATHGFQGPGGGAPSCTRWWYYSRGCDVSSNVPQGIPGVQGIYRWVENTVIDFDIIIDSDRNQQIVLFQYLIECV